MGWQGRAILWHNQSMARKLFPLQSGQPWLGYLPAMVRAGARMMTTPCAGPPDCECYALSKCKMGEAIADPPTFPSPLPLLVTGYDSARLRFPARFDRSQYACDNRED